MADGQSASRLEQDLWWKVGRYSVGTAFRIAFRLRWYGLDRLPASGSALVVSNHISVLDSIAIGIAVSDRERIIRFLAAAEVFRIPVIGSGMRRIRQIPLRRGKGDWGALGVAAGVIRTGGLAGIFPEGRVSDDGEVQVGRKGAARLALAAGVPVVPVAIWGTQVRWPQTGLTLRRPIRPNVAVIVGEPIITSGDPRDPPAVRDLTERIMTDVSSLVAEARRLAPNHL
jgi:1-acyl-sn-glycerol-3-phosphate acyltransferase